VKARATQLALCMILAVALSCCGGSAEPDPLATTAPTPIVITDAAQAPANLLNRFSLELFRRMDDGQKNILVCTQSVGISLGMLRIGAAGTTASQMDAVLGFTGLVEDALPALFRRLSDNLSAVDGLDLDLIHGLYVGEGPTVREKYIETVLDTFDAPVTLIDFTQPVTLELVNDWVGQVSGGRVDRLFDSLDPGTRVLLVDSAIFAGQWLRAFDRRTTTPLPFTIEDGHPVVVSVMYGQAEMARYTGDDADCLYMPLDGGGAEFWLLLPPKNVPLADFVDSLTADALSAWRDQATDGLWKVMLPRLTLTWSGDLSGVLSDMGASELFDAQSADLSNMGTGLYLSRAQHRAQLTLDETGAQEALIKSPALSQEGKDDAIFTATRPFAFLVVGQPSGTILFAGTLHNPLPGT
jgi:serine protease inhibitor